MVTKLELINFGTLDITDDIPIALNFNLNDVRDISNRGGVWSKTIKIPGTQNNNDKLGNIYNVNLQTQTFNPVIKENCRIIIDGITIFEGVFQLRKVNKKFKNSQDFQIEYICYIKSDVSSFYETISGKYLTDLDLSQYNHNWEISTVTHSMHQGVWQDGYQYYLSYKDNYQYAPRNFVPGVYAKTYWDNIFNDSGFTYQWDGLGDLNFDKMIIPYNGGEFKPRVDGLYKFNAGFATLATYDLWSATSQVAPPATIFLTPEVIIPDSDDNSGEGWSDPNDRYNTTTGRYDVTDFYGNMEFNMKFFTQIELSLVSGVNLDYDIINRGDFLINIGYEALLKDSSGNTIAQISGNGGLWQSGTVGPNPLLSGTFRSGEQILETLDVDVNFIYNSFNYVDASYIEVVFSAGFSDITNNPFRGFQSTGSGNLYNPTISFRIPPQNNDSGHYTNKPDNQVVENAPIQVNKLIPKKITQASYILSIVKMFNLYITTDKYDPTTLIIKTRDKFYDDGIELDWTSKIDNKSVDVEILSNTQHKRKLFSYKEDTKDELSVLYKETTNEIYGQLEYIFENEFIKGTEKVEPIFSPTFIIRGGNEGVVNVVPSIQSSSPKNNIRILYIGDILTGSWAYDEGGLNTPGPSGSVSYLTKYRYAGHLYPNPFSPTDDLFFGRCDYYDHNYPEPTDNNLYNRFYKTQMNIFENGHIMTAHFNLTYKDILNINLDERIYVYDSWWNINEIIDFDMNKEGLTKVELITADPKAELFTPNNRLIVSDSSPNEVNVVINNSSFTRGTENVIGAGVVFTLIGGSGNIIQPGSSNNNVMGDYNNVSGNNNFVQGTNNLVNGSNLTLLGASNTTLEGNNIIQIGGTNSTVVLGSTSSTSFSTFDVSTSDATVTNIASFGVSIPQDNVSWYEAYITGVQSDGSNGYGSRVYAVVKNDGGVVSLVNKTDVIEKTDWIIGVTSDIVVSGTDVLVQVTGLAATDINWICNITYRT